MLRVVVGVEGDGDLVDPGDLAAEHPRADVQAWLGLEHTGSLEVPDNTNFSYVIKAQLKTFPAPRCVFLA